MTPSQGLCRTSLSIARRRCVAQCDRANDCRRLLFVADERREWATSIGTGTQRNTLSIFGVRASDTSAATKLFNVSDDLSKVFERDRTVAGIAKDRRINNCRE